MKEITEVNKSEFYKRLKEVFVEGVVLTAREASVELRQRFSLGDGTRQAVHPRITEMVDNHLLYEVGKKYDKYTKKIVTAYCCLPLDKEADI